MSTPSPFAVTTPLTRQQVTDARRQHCYLLAQNVIAQHVEDGGMTIPSGRVVHLMGATIPDNEYTYFTSEMYVVFPGKTDSSNRIPPDIARMTAPKKRPFRLLVVPPGREFEYLSRVLEGSTTHNQ